ncbi:DUF2147 domain-containing protein [Pseudoduganella umbonata]|uniref:DUF2147 domain-containing protein n=1 Tax=Pseudoduganella umbonata TaxID=864828 RepID=A0A4P8HVF2_9BURK|nr:DUF2147 domain-containing protein [Pseudoduganella umbonata]MBB3224574.1 uncharacterized protein (DUF2147 family) [Pseudoduganella umbonata]QCP13336.1 DUF2147 domain-containing protein [Pseudoduganella umbonata]
MRAARCTAPLFFTLSLLATALPALAGNASAVGLWKSIDDQTGKPKADIRISESNGVLKGRVEKLYRAPGEDQHPTCDNCKGEDKGRPVIGLSIIDGMKKDGDAYGGGTILDPENGKVYKSRMKLLEGGAKLEVRGYIGIPALGRSQTWIRQE